MHIIIFMEPTINVNKILNMHMLLWLVSFQNFVLEKFPLMEFIPIS